MEKKVIILVVFVSIILSKSLVKAADIEAVLDDAAGASALSIKDSGSVEGAHIDSDGNMVIKGGLRLDAAGAENTTAENLIVDGSVGIGVTTPTAVLHLKAGTAAASTSPLKLTSGTLLTTPEAGAIEFLTDAYYGTITTGPARRTFAFREDKLSAFAATTSAELIGVLSDETGTGLAVFGTTPTFTTSIITPTVIGGTATTSDLNLQTTSGVGAAGADMHFLVGNNGGTEAMTILNNGRVGIGAAAPGALLDISSTNPIFHLTDTTASAKSLKIDVDADIAQIREQAGAANSLLSFDLTNNTAGIGGTPIATAGRVLRLVNSVDQPWGVLNIEAGGNDMSSSFVVNGKTAAGGTVELRFTASKNSELQFVSSGNYDYVFYNNTGGEVFRLIPANKNAIFANKVGIGAATPTAFLHTAGTAGTVTFEANSNETTATNNVLMLRSDVASADDAIFRVRADGATFADGAYTGTGADYAEWFEKESELAPKDVVGLNLVTGKVRKYQAGDILIGVYSQKPGFVGNQSLEKTDEEMRSNYALVALMGQVDVRYEQIRVQNGRVYTQDGIQLGFRLANGKVLLRI